MNARANMFRETWRKTNIDRVVDMARPLAEILDSAGLVSQEREIRPAGGHRGGRRWIRPPPWGLRLGRSLTSRPFMGLRGGAVIL